MKIKGSNLEWYVLKYDANSDSIVKYNVMTGIAELLHKKIKSKQVHDKASLKEFLKKQFMYNYWSRTEYEILVSGLSSNADIEKIDMYEQALMNLDNITEYVNLRCDLKY